MIALREGTILPNEVVINAKWFFSTDQATALEQISKMMDLSQHHYLEKVRYSVQSKSFDSIEDFEAAAKASEEREAARKNTTPRYFSQWTERRAEILKRDNYRCVKCGSGEKLECDHITPLCEGGSHEPENLRTLCKPCHMEETKNLFHRRKELYA